METGAAAESAQGDQQEDQRQHHARDLRAPGIASSSQVVKMRRQRLHAEVMHRA